MPVHVLIALGPNPTAIRLTFATNAADIWSALKSETAPPKPKALPEPQAIVVWRQDFMARFRSLSTEEAMMWNEAAKGVRFGVLCEMVATFAGTDGAELRAASYLRGWVDMGVLADCRLAPSPRLQVATGLGPGNSASLLPVTQ
jgi:hypothetical protein